MVAPFPQAFYSVNLPLLQQEIEFSFLSLESRLAFWFTCNQQEIVKKFCCEILQSRSKKAMKFPPNFLGMLGLGEPGPCVRNPTALRPPGWKHRASSLQLTVPCELSLLATPAPTHVSSAVGSL